MKLMTKRLLAVALAIVMTLGMTISAMADWEVSDEDLRAAGLDPAKAIKIAEIWVETGDEENPSPTSGKGWTRNEDGTYTIDFRYLDLSQFTKLVIFHFVDGKVEAVEFKFGATATFDSASPFVLYGVKTADSDGSSTPGSGSGSDSSKSSSSKSSSSKSSSSSKKSPKTGMDDSWMLWLMAAGVLAGSSVIAYNRKRG